MRLAHLTDLHLPIPAPPKARELLNKRALGYLSWLRTRRHRHSAEALAAVASDCRRMAPDFTAISGDIVNISLESEFQSSIQWLKEYFDPAATAMIPGNHDAYVPVSWARGVGTLSQYMAGARQGSTVEAPPVGPDDFPFVRTVGDVSLVFANSSPPTAPGLATGRLGRRQIDRIAADLTRLGARGQCRVLVLHHPVTEGTTSRRKALDDAQLLRAAVFDAGVELVLHGHTHRSEWASLDTREGQRPVVGGGSASHPRARRKYRPARYNLFTIDRAPGEGWRIDVEVRELDPRSGEVKTAEIRNLLPRLQGPGPS